jgi:uncharacterized membrane protein HdeD (DUF308 family)
MTLILARNWWVLGLRGVVAILFGLLAFALPGLTLGVLVILFGAYALVDGVVAIVAAVRAAERHERWGPMLVAGLAGVGAGVVTFAWPLATAVGLLYLISAWALVLGVFKIVSAIRLRRLIPGEGWLLLNGVLSVAFGIVLLAAPGMGLLALVWWVGAAAIVQGVLFIALAHRLRGHHHTHGGRKATTA